MSPVAYITDPYLFKVAVYILTFLYLQDILYIFIYIVASLSRHAVNIGVSALMYNIGVALMYPYSGNSTTGLCSISMEKNILGEMKKHIYIPTNI